MCNGSQRVPESSAAGWRPSRPPSSNFADALLATSSASLTPFRVPACFLTDVKGVSGLAAPRVKSLNLTLDEGSQISALTPRPGRAKHAGAKLNNLPQLSEFWGSRTTSWARRCRTVDALDRTPLGRRLRMGVPRVGWPTGGVGG